jgi:DNA-binding PadR family transcriptional regulator
MRGERPLTATSFAILGLLALRPWRTYDLAKQIGRSLSHFWPRAESNLYAEPKRLVAGGYVVARRERNGGRRRTVYMITPQGREALRDWLAEPGGEVRLESEALLKVFFADQGGKSDLLDTIRAMGEAAAQRLGILRQAVEEYRAGHGPFPERLAVGTLAMGLVWDHLETTVAWSRRAATAVERWRGPGPGEAPLWPADILAPPHSDGSTVVAPNQNAPRRGQRRRPRSSRA